MPYENIFWLHIKKSAGITTRQLLQPYYIEVDRVKKPKNFIQASPEEYNDILNNYRVVLGEYQFRRCQFAKKILYPDRWDKLFSFAFSREPTDRCISMFYYLYWKRTGRIRRIARSIKMSLAAAKFVRYSDAYLFDQFLDYVYQARISDSIYFPLDNHFTTHTAPMWDDVTDEDGNMLLKAVFRLENLIQGINRAFEECGIEKRLDNSGTTLNRNKRRQSYQPTRQQRAKIEDIYQRDFEIYEKAL